MPYAHAMPAPAVSYWKHGRLGGRPVATLRKVANSRELMVRERGRTGREGWTRRVQRPYQVLLEKFAVSELALARGDAS